ncbi:MAG: hypothetical protein JWP81_3549 [Ferruginibacter sp.]|nr:hypothetical protein [Ferruginibacter sp.]
MATIKKNPKKTAKEKTIITKFAGQVGHLAGEIIAGKDHLIEIAGDAIESVKTTLQNIAVKKKAAPKKAGKAKPKEPVAKSAGAGVKKVAKPAAPKKTAPAKKAVKEATRKVAGKK